VPNGPNDVATFATSNITEVTFHNTDGDRSIEVNAIVFNPGASPFSINPTGRSITISGAGVINNSGITQNFVTETLKTGSVIFKGSATAGDLVQYMTSGDGDAIFGFSFFDNSTAATATFVLSAGNVSFWDNSSAENSTIIVNGGGDGAFSGEALFNGNSTASHAQIFVNGATEDDRKGGFASFDYIAATADQAVITVRGSDVGSPGQVSFQNFATAANATLIAQPGQAYGGQISFSLGSPTGGTATIKLFGNGTLTDYVDDYLEIGSLEGDGLVSLGSLEGANLAVGRSNLSTIFSGLIGERTVATSSTLTKIGTGTLKLSGANTYTGGTIVEQGKLVVGNSTGSATGTGPVQVNGGTFGGKGIASGSVTVGAGSGGGAILAPGVAGSVPTVLTIQGNLTFKADATYLFKLNAKKARTDMVIANGATIESGAQFDINTVGNKKLTTGKVFTAISNTATTPISGTFANLADGSTVTVGVNKLQVSYSGGDGNDLTLTVVP